jgi:hypothetical protein
MKDSDKHYLDIVFPTILMEWFSIELHVIMQDQKISSVHSSNNIS